MEDPTSLDFFLDRDVIMNLEGRLIEEAQGHVHLLGGNGEDSIKVPAIVDGSTIDFLFGIKRIHDTTQAPSCCAKVNRVKAYINSLDDHEKEAVADFYYFTFRSIVKFYKQLDQPCNYLMYNMLETELSVELEEAVENLTGFLNQTENPLALGYYQQQ